jgi:nicotinate phosphoribosyltransferase
MKESLLNLQDQYKFPMGDLIHQKNADAEVTFRMHNRRPDRMRIADYVSVEELQAHYDSLRDLQFTPEELGWLRDQTDALGKQRYRDSYLGYLASFRLPEIHVYMDEQHNDIAAEVTAPWNESSLWEIPMLSQLSELWYPRYLAANGINPAAVWADGDRRLDDFIAKVNATPGFSFAEFGTRRRYSSDWQDHAVERFKNECPEHFLGTSNPHLARKYGIAAIGTNAHELSMTYAALEESRGGYPLDGQNQVIADWLERYPDMPVALIDTFTSDVTLHDMTQEQLERVASYRIDSGDERKIGAKVIAVLEKVGIDPHTKTLFFSNSLSIDKALALDKDFRQAGRIGAKFGIGGHSVNNMGDGNGNDIPSWNAVAKAVTVNGRGTVKLSDDSGKHMGESDDVDRYLRLARQRMATPAAHSPELLECA